ncbi:hypothetical protein K438DRAFT_1695300, partial [Mycena galopus ATCC 62051]
MSDETTSTNPAAGGRSLGGGPTSEPLPEAWVRPADPPRVGRIGAWSANNNPSGTSTSGPRIASLRDIAPPPRPARAPAPVPHNHDDESDEDDDDEDEDKPPETLFAGGERSGINVENPDVGRNRNKNRDRTARAPPGGDDVRELLRRAAETGAAPILPAPGSSTGFSFFSGGGHTLGSDDIPSTFVPDPDAVSTELPPAERRLTFWRDGFTIEDGPLMSYEVRENAEILRAIKAGLAPPSLLAVAPGQPVHMLVAERTAEMYVPPRTTWEGGHRLGAVVPGAC